MSNIIIRFYRNNQLNHEIVLDSLICPNCGRLFFESDCELENMGKSGYCLCGRDLKKYPIVTSEEWTEFFNRVTFQR